MVKALPHAHYEEVARIYNEVLASGGDRRKTNLAIHQQLGCTYSQANNWVARCKKLGLLSERPKLCSCRCPVHCPS